MRCHQKISNNKKNFCLYAAFVRDYSFAKANTMKKLLNKMRICINKQAFIEWLFGQKSFFMHANEWFTSQQSFSTLNNVVASDESSWMCVCLCEFCVASLRQSNLSFKAILFDTLNSALFTNFFQWKAALKGRKERKQWKESSQWKGAFHRKRTQYSGDRKFGKTLPYSTCLPHSLRGLREKSAKNLIRCLRLRCLGKVSRL